MSDHRTDPRGEERDAQTWEVVFEGELYVNADPDVVKERLGRLFDQDAAGIERLFVPSGVIIKRGISRAAAEQYQVEMAKAGAMCKVQPDGVLLSSTQELPSATKAQFKVDTSSREFSISGIHAAVLTCPKCEHRQLQAEMCINCGVDIEHYRKLLKKRERLEQKRAREAAAFDTSDDTSDDTTDHAQNADASDPAQSRSGQSGTERDVEIEEITLESLSGTDSAELAARKSSTPPRGAFRERDFEPIEPEPTRSSTGVVIIGLLLAAALGAAVAAYLLL